MVCKKGETYLLETDYLLGQAVLVSDRSLHGLWWARSEAVLAVAEFKEG